MRRKWRKKFGLEQKDYSLIDDILSVKSEAYQKLQVNLEYANVDKKIQVIAVTSALKSEGKSTMICNLAKVYGLKGKKTILIDLDLRRPTAHRFYKLENTNGVTEYCAGKIEKEQLINHCEGDVDVIVAGEKTPFPAKILESNKLKNLIEDLKKEYEYVLIDVPPILMVADAMIISSFCDGFLYVVTHGDTKIRDFKEAIATLNQNNINVIGIVMTMVNKDRSGSGYYYSSYYNSSYM